MKSRFEDYLKQVAARTLENGGTASKPAVCEFLPVRDLWCFPKYPSKTVILPPGINLINELRNFISRNEDFLNEDDCWLGTWINPQSGEYYFDVAMGVENLEEAQAYAMQAGKDEGRAIVAMYNPQKNQTVFLK